MAFGAYPNFHRGLGGLPMCGTFDVSTTYNRVEFEVYFPDPLALNSTNHHHQDGSYPLPYPGTPVLKVLRRFVPQRALQWCHDVSPRCQP